MDLARHVAARCVARIVPLQHRLHVGRRSDADQRLTDCFVIRMAGGVLDAELPHHDRRTFFAVGLLAQAVMLTNHVGLLAERRRRRQRFAAPQCRNLVEDPRIADRSAGDRDAIDAGLVDHVDAVRGGEQITAAEDQPLRADVAFDFGEKLPATRTDVALFDGAAVDGDRRDAAGERAIEDAEKMVSRLLAVIHPAAHFYRHRTIRRDALSDAVDDLQGHLGLRQMKTAAAPPEHLLHRTAEVDIDDIKARFGEFDRSGGKLLRLAAHQLTADGMFFVGDVKEVTGLGSIGQRDEKLVEHHLAQRVRCTVSAGQNPHRQIAVPAQRRLEKRRCDRDVTDSQRPAPFWNTPAMPRLLPNRSAGRTGADAPVILSSHVINPIRTVLATCLLAVLHLPIGNNLAHSDTPKNQSGTVMQIQTLPFGQTADGQDVSQFILTNSSGNSIRLTNYGAVLMDVNIADAAGKIANVNLAFDSLEPYLDRHPHFGSTIGRFANRIARGQFKIDGQPYQVTINSGPHHLHGGAIGFDHLLWDAETYNDNDIAGVRFRLVSPDGMEGYPGTVNVLADYSFSETNELAMTFTATTDAPDARQPLQSQLLESRRRRQRLSDGHGADDPGR